MENDEVEILVSEMINWGKRLSENQITKYPDKLQMRGFLTECGADLKAVEGHEKSMKKWTDAGMAEAMETIWGEKWDDIKNWNEEFIKNFEEKTGRILPSISVYKKGEKEVVRRSKKSSMKHVLGVITRWAAFDTSEDPEFDEKRYFDEINVRITNGLLKSQGASVEDLMSISRPDTGEKYHPSLPPEYPLALIDKLLKE